MISRVRHFIVSAILDLNCCQRIIYKYKYKFGLVERGLQIVQGR